MAQTRHVKCSAPPLPIPSFTVVWESATEFQKLTAVSILPLSNTPSQVHSCAAKSIPANPPPSLSLSLSLTHTHTHTPCSHMPTGSRWVWAPPPSTLGKGCDSAKGGGCHTHPTLQAHAHTHTHTHIHTHTQAHVSTYSHLPRTGSVAICCIIGLRSQHRPVGQEYGLQLIVQLEQQTRSTVSRLQCSSAGRPGRPGVQSPGRSAVQLADQE